MEQGKLAYVRKVQETATSLMELMHTLEDIQAIYDARQYGPGLPNAFTDSELALLDAQGMRSCTADNLYAFVIFCAQYKTMLENGTPAQRDYKADLNHLRLDL